MERSHSNRKWLVPVCHGAYQPQIKNVAKDHNGICKSSWYVGQEMEMRLKGKAVKEQEEIEQRHQRPFCDTYIFCSFLNNSNSKRAWQGMDLV